MKAPCALVRILALGLLGAAPGTGAEPAGDLDADLADALRGAVRSARGIPLDDRAVSGAELDAAAAAAASAESRADNLSVHAPGGGARRRLLKRIARLRARLDEAAAAAADPGGGPAEVVERMEREIGRASCRERV